MKVVILEVPPHISGGKHGQKRPLPIFCCDLVQGMWAGHQHGLRFTFFGGNPRLGELAKNSGNFWILDPLPILPGDIGCLRKRVS